VSGMEEEIPYFIKMRGCINCDISKAYKKRTGNEYGFDHELMVTCLLLGCENYGVSLLKPFLDPFDVLQMAREKYPDHIEKLLVYVTKITNAFGHFYIRLGVHLEDLVEELEEEVYG